ncbi:MAG: hypothetical protein GY798_04075 [Hyphomicrobiales bacterium]|nr:hypothetical protein [Hyphomicrobiales bacterium]
MIPKVENLLSFAGKTVASGETWAKLYVSQATPGELIKGGEIDVTGDAAEAVRLMDLFDQYIPEKAVVVPPAAFSSQR